MNRADTVPCGTSQVNLKPISCRGQPTASSRKAVVEASSKLGSASRALSLLSPRICATSEVHDSRLTAPRMPETLLYPLWLCFLFLKSLLQRTW